MVGSLHPGWVNGLRPKPGRVYVFLRTRDRMVSFTTRKTFEMVLVVSLTRSWSSFTSKDNLVIKRTIVINRF